MRKLLAVSVLMLGMAVSAKASDLVYSTFVVNRVFAPTQNVDLDLNQYGIDSLSVQLVYSSANPSATTFTDGNTSTGNFIVSNLASLTTAYATNKITVASDASIVGTAASAQITIVSTATAGIVLRISSYTFTSGTDWPIAGLTVTQAADNLAHLLNGYQGVFVATRAAGVVYATTTYKGTLANEYPLSSSNTNYVNVSGSYFTGGVEPALRNAWLSINGVTYYNGIHWTSTNYSTGAAVALANLIGATSIATATAGGSIVYTTATTVGSAANAYTLTASTFALTIASATYSGGQDNARIRISNYDLICNTNWFVGATSTATAISISSAINNGPTRFIVSAATGSSTIFTTSTVAGFFTNYQLYSSTPTGLIPSGTTMTRGADSDLVPVSSTSPLYGYFNYQQIAPGSPFLNTSTLYKTPTSLGIGSGLLYTKSAGTDPANLVANTTYFATNLGTNNFQLASSAANALLGTAITVGTVTQTGGGSFALTPLALAGTPAFKLQKSDDGTNFTDIAVSTSPILAPMACSVSFASPYTASSLLCDMGDVFFRYLRLAFTGGTAGGVTINEVANGKKR